MSKRIIIAGAGHGGLIAAAKLAKAGYKPNEVKELMEMAAQQNHDEQGQNHDEQEQNNDEQEQEQNQDEQEQNQDESNEISKLNDRIAELEKELKVAQEHNRRSGGNQHEEPAPEDYLKDVMRNFY